MTALDSNKPASAKPALLIASVFLISVAYYWQGLGPLGDAERYIQYAMIWRDSPPYLGDTHWALRHIFVLPMAASFKLFGANEFTATLPNIVYAGGLVAITFYFARKYVGLSEAVFASVLVSTSAFLVSKPLEIAIYGPEVFFCALASWLVVAAENERRRIFLLALAGVSVGFAWTLREQTSAIMVAFAVLMLLMRRQVLLSWFALGVGFGSVLAIELVVYWAVAGNPLYRYDIDLHHRVTGWGAAKPMAVPYWVRVVTPIKDILSDPLTTPVLALSIGLALIGKRIGMFENQPVSKSLFAFGVIAMVCVPIAAIGFNLALPRYYPIFPYFIALVSAFSIAALVRRYGVGAGGVAVAVIILTNVAVEEFTSYKEYSEARILLRHVEESNEPIFTDPLTASRVRHLLLMKGMERSEISSRVRSTRNAPAGVLFYEANPLNRIEAFGCVIASEAPPRGNWMHWLLRRTGLGEKLGTKVRRIVQEPKPVELVRVAPPGSELNCRSAR